MIVVAAVALIAVITLSVGGTWYFLGTSNATSEPVPVHDTAAKQAAVYEELVPAFVVNFHSAGKPRYLQVSVALMGRDKAELEALKVHMPTLRNQLVMLFSSQDFDELNSPLGVELLKQKYTVTINKSVYQQVISNLN